MSASHDVEYGFIPSNFVVLIWSYIRFSESSYECHNTFEYMHKNIHIFLSSIHASTPHAHTPTDGWRIRFASTYAYKRTFIFRNPWMNWDHGTFAWILDTTTTSTTTQHNHEKLLSKSTSHVYFRLNVLSTELHITAHDHSKHICQRVRAFDYSHCAIQMEIRF